MNSPGYRSGDSKDRLPVADIQPLERVASRKSDSNPSNEKLKEASGNHGDPATVEDDSPPKKASRQAGSGSGSDSGPESNPKKTVHNSEPANSAIKRFADMIKSGKGQSSPLQVTPPQITVSHAEIRIHDIRSLAKSTPSDLTY